MAVTRQGLPSAPIIPMVRSYFPCRIIPACGALPRRLRAPAGANGSASAAR